ncbi:glycogenin glucosyltransferase [Batrachochytrium dendrobatidis]|nr:glycogenin glucosyltransferase [Batrachochytrium dendrobatidis]KAK5671177.1 glycogenin glucosyltransferase [Batrachochytrium dendrobatidis]
MQPFSYAYVSLLTTESYLPGALVLAASIRQTSTLYPLVIIVSQDHIGHAAIQTLLTVYDKVIPVQQLLTNSNGNLNLLGRPDLFATFTKLHLWNPDILPYSRIVFLDADTLVQRNIDCLFQYVEQESVVFAAAPDAGWPDCFNSGVFVTKPCAVLFHQLLEYAANNTSFDGGDQGLLNSFFSSWSCESPVNPRTGRLPFTFNVTPSAFYSYLPAFHHYSANISIVHFIGSTKPWKMSRFFDGSIMPFGEMSDGVKDLMASWWAVFDKNELHLVLRTFKLDRDWSQYQVPNQTPGMFEAIGSFASSGFQTSALGALPNSASEFGRYRVDWNDRESRSAMAVSRSRSPAKRRSRHSKSPRRGESLSKSPTKLNSSHGKRTSPLDSRLGGSGKNGSPVKSEAASGSHQHGAGHLDAITIASATKSSMSYTTPTDDFANYRVSWSRHELRGQAAQRSPKSDQMNSKSSDSENDSSYLIFTSDEASSSTGYSSTADLDSQFETETLKIVNPLPLPHHIHHKLDALSIKPTTLDNTVSDPQSLATSSTKKTGENRK